MKFFITAMMFLMMACSGGNKPHFEGANESEKFNRFADTQFEKFLSMSPEGLANFGRKEKYNQLDNYTLEFSQQRIKIMEDECDQLKHFDRSAMDEPTQLSYDLSQKSCKELPEDKQWINYGYAVNQQGGIHTNLPVFMINIHKVDTEKDLQDYISRLKEFRRVFAEVIEQMKISESKGIVPPQFVFPYVLEAAKKVIQGAPFEKSKKDSPLLQDFKAKLKSLKLNAAQNKKYNQLAEEALVQSVQPAYNDLLAFMSDQEKRATKEDGVWKLPRGDAFYKHQLRRFTTTDMTADEVHKLGLQNVQRLRDEMTVIKNKLGFKGDLKSFFEFLRKDPKQYFPNTPQGQQAYLNQAKAYQKSISQKVPEFFRHIPKAAMEVRAVEKFRESSAGKAFYDSPSDDGRRPGIYYVNLQNTKNAPKFENEALFYHEGIPGHHFQLALSIELKNLPLFRRYSHYTSFIEGWGLYAERLGKDMGGYTNLYSELGRLSMEMIRACRLVVDTGIHSKKWTREQGIQYFADNLPVAEGMQKEQVERFIIWPGQATAYMIGMLKIVELREKAKNALGSRFDIRDFHDVVLESGALPLDILEKQVNSYIQKKSRSSKAG